MRELWNQSTKSTIRVICGRNPNAGELRFRSWGQVLGRLWRRTPLYCTMTMICLLHSRHTSNLLLVMVACRPESITPSLVCSRPKKPRDGNKELQSCCNPQYTGHTKRTAEQ